MQSVTAVTMKSFVAFWIWGILLKVVICTAPESLRFVNILYRHGDRSPIQTFPSDPYQESFWPQGFGQLSKIGMEQEWSLGKFIRDRYDGFVNSSYRRLEILIESTDVDRTLMSAQAVLNGLYPPSEVDRFRSDIPWVPIPVHTRPGKEDHIFMMAECPKLNNWKDDFLHSAKVVNAVMPIYGDFLESIHDQAGYKYNRSQVFGQINTIRDALFIEKLYNLSLPVWGNDDTFSKLDELGKLLQYLTEQEDTPRPLEGGAMLDAFLTDFEQTIEHHDDIEQLKMHMYSGHDTNIIAMLHALKIYTEGDLIPYSTILMIELHAVTNNSYIVKIFIRFGLQGDVKQRAIPGCDEDCPFDKFLNLTAAVRMENRGTYCKNFSIFDLSQNILSLLVVILGGLLIFILLICVVAMCCCRCLCRRPPMKYRVLEKGLHNHDSEHVPMMSSTGSGFSDED